MRSLRSIVLVGGTGFIGSTLAQQLLALEEVKQLIVVDKHHASSLPGHLAGIYRDPRFDYLQSDLGDRPLISQLLMKFACTGLFNCADQNPPARRTGVGAEYFLPTNVSGTALLLAACRDQGVPMLQCSTDEVYGTITSPDRLGEEAIVNPLTPYATSKACAELLCLSAHQTHGQDLVITRGSMTFGPRQPAHQLLPILIQGALQDHQLLLSGNGMEIRDWIHVDDHCAGLIAAFQRGKAGSIYNLGGNCERTDLGIARHVLKVLGKPESLLATEEPKASLSLRRALDCTKAARYFSWYPRIDFKNHFAEVVRELAANLVETDHAASKCSR